VVSPRARPRGCSRGALVVWVMLAAWLATFLVPESARASTASIFSDLKTPKALVYEAAAGEANQVLIVRTSNATRVIDSGATITAGTGCTSVSPDEVSCERSFRLVISVGDLGDLVTIGGIVPASVEGGDGNDTLEGGDGPDRLRGGTGADTLTGGNAFDDRGRFETDILEGGEGNDELRPGEGFGAVLRGGPGADTFHPGERDFGVRVDYSDYALPVAASADGLPNDGAAGEGDNLLAAGFFIQGGSGGDTVTGFNAEGNGGNDHLVGGFLDGGAGNDTLRANGAFAFMIGGRGNDIMRGSGSEDDIRGGPGRDRLGGGGGPDYMDGGPGADVMQGSTGRDSLFGGPGRDLVRGGRGNDRFFLRDGRRDTANGGGGFDRARIDNGLDRVRLIERLF
jgi:Ca2+-binding RTX toxin-like protein